MEHKKQKINFVERFAIIFLSFCRAHSCNVSSSEPTSYQRECSELFECSSNVQRNGPKAHNRPNTASPPTFIYVLGTFSSSRPHS